MGTITDPNDDIREFQNERQRIQDADIPEDDRDAILALGDAQRSDNTPGYAADVMASCRKVSVRAKVVGVPPLVEWDKPTFNRFMVRMEDADFPEEHLPRGGSWSAGYLRGFRQHLKNLLTNQGHEWAEDIHIGEPPEPSVEREDLLTQEELTALWKAADHPRDACIVALPLATWQRNAALRSLRVGDVHLSDDQTGYITLNDDDDTLGQKGAEGKRPLTWATGPVERWLDKHPRRDDDDFQEAPLLCVITNAGDAVKGRMLSSTESLNRRLRMLAERAGLDRDRYDTTHGRSQRTISAHTLRYTGITRAAISDEYNDTTVKAWAGWEMNTPQLQRYVKVVMEDVLAAADEAHGIESELPNRPEFDHCPRCGGPVEEWHNACPKCTSLLTDEMWGTRENLTDIHEDATEAAIESTDPDEIEGAKVLRELTDQDGADTDALAEQVFELQQELAALKADLDR